MNFNPLPLPGRGFFLDGTYNLDKKVNYDQKRAGDASVARYLKSTNYWNGSNAGLDSYGFRALPAGFYGNGNSKGKNEIAVFHAMNDASSLAYSVLMYYSNNFVEISDWHNYSSFTYDGTSYSTSSMKSLRCIYTTWTHW